MAREAPIGPAGVSPAVTRSNVPGAVLFREGKVREVYEAGPERLDSARLLDRSALDFNLTRKVLFLFRQI